MTLIALGAALSLASCVGGTDEASNIRATQARLNAHGHTTGKPATWWWEYDTVKADLGTANDIEVCGAGPGPKEPDRRCGPAQSPNANDVPLNVVVTGLAPNTTYYYRACGQDQGASSPSCGKTLTLRTTKANSTARIEQRSGDSLDPVVFSAALATRQGFRAGDGQERPMTFSTLKQSNGALKYRIEDTATPDGQAGTSITPSAGCQSIANRKVDDAVECTPSDPEADIHLGDQDDYARVQGPGLSHFIYVDCGSGTDTLVIDRAGGFDNYAWTGCETVSEN